VCCKQFINKFILTMNDEAANGTSAGSQLRRTRKNISRGGGLVVEKSAEKIRVELNIEKWPGIWQPAKGHTKLAARTLERNVQIRDGGLASSKLVIGFTDLGTLTTEDQRMFYALIKQWENSGKPVGRPVYFSDRLLSRLLRKKGWGTNVIEAISGSLRRLRLTPLRWIKSFHRSDDAAHEYEEEIPFQMLDDLKIVTRKSHGHVTNQQGYFQFNKHIETNLMSNYTKPLLEEVFFGLESEIAQLVYTHIDLIMFGKTRYERCTKELFADLGLTGTSYRFKSNRKQKLQRALIELQGVRLNHGVLKSATLVETADGHDYKVVFLKGAARDLPALDERSETEDETVVVNHYAKSTTPEASQAEAVVRQFHLVVHGVDSHEPQSKEVSQALTLIGQYGFEKIMYLVGYAAEQAKRTNFNMQHFGAVLNYASRASADFDRANQKVPPVLQPAPPRTEPEENKWTTGIRRLAILTPEQQHERFETTKAVLFAENPFLAGHWKEGSGIQEKLIRARVVRDLETEPMEITAPGFYDWLPSVVRPTSFQTPKTTDSVTSKSAL
jgi:hypothetical protein